MLLISAGHMKHLTDAAEAAYPHEACGLLVGRTGVGAQRVVERIEISGNVAADTLTRFEVDPGLRIGIERELRGGPKCVLGVWHSHPDHPAAPSETDLAMAYEPDLVWLITAVYAGQAVQTAAFMVRDGGGGFRSFAMLMHA
ncbi:MAG TPA: M67 family metallopeptidase [Candidatus Cybelea sp.]|nr:M67 family metallopeptidase [Candidatus Cybelea sp.]